MPRKGLSLGCWLILVLISLGVFACLTLLVGLPEISLLWRHGVTTQGVITDESFGGCGRHGSGDFISVQFTDQTGQVHTSSFDNCSYSFPNPSYGGSITIVYSPDNPTVIAPSGRFPIDAFFIVSMTILMGLLTLILLPRWIRKRARKLS